MRAAGAGRCAAFALSCAGCVGGEVASPTLDARAFVEAEARIAELRSAASTERTDSVSLELDAPYLPSRLKARGAMAVRAPDALRMIMLGPGGTTAMDLWLDRGRFIFEIPAIGRRIVGDGATSARDKRGLPVDFLQAWMLAPLGGRLLAAARDGSELKVLIDEPPNKIVEATISDAGAIRAHRSWFSEDRELIEEEWIEATGLGCATATYRQRTTSLSVVARCEKSRPGLNAAALEEPAPVERAP